MTKEEAIERIKSRYEKWSLNDKDLEAIQYIFPELKDGEDERIRREIIEFIQWSEDRGMTRHDFHQAKRPSEWLAYLERQKEQKSVEWTELTWKDIVELERIINNVHYDFSAGIGQESFGKEVLERFRSTKGIEYLDEAEQKYWREEEQKSAEYEEDSNDETKQSSPSIDIAESVKTGRIGALKNLLSYLKYERKSTQEEIKLSFIPCIEKLLKEIERKSAEWSEEDEKMRQRILTHLYSLIYPNSLYREDASECISWLKALEPRPTGNLSISFMNYLDDHRPDSKMCLSNSECKDIDNAFKENDWAKIIRYAKKYSSSWKPSNE